MIGPSPGSLRRLRSTVLQGWHLFWMAHTRHYRTTFLGYFWLLAKPVVAFVPLLVVGRALRFADVESTHMPYTIYAFSGVVLWQAFSTTAAQILSVFKSARKRARRLQFDPLAPVVLALLQTSLNVTILFVVLLSLAAVQRFPLSPAVLLFPIPAAVMTATAVTVTLPLVLADAMYRDAQRSWGFVSQLMFWSLPVVHLPPDGTILRAIVRWHPLTPCFEMWRGMLTGAVTAHTGIFLVWMFAVTVVLVLVVRFFRDRFWEALDYAR